MNIGLYACINESTIFVVGFMENEEQGKEINIK